jgi:hypothetical protein
VDFTQNVGVKRIRAALIITSLLNRTLQWFSSLQDDRGDSHNSIVEAIVLASGNGMNRRAGIFSSARTRPQLPGLTGSPKTTPLADIILSHTNTALPRSDLDLEVGSGQKGGKLIAAAFERAEERKSMAEELKSKRIQREIAELESQNSIVKRESLPMRDEMDSKRCDKYGEEEYDFEAMRQRYLQRREATDLLKLSCTSTQLKMIIHWVDLCKDGEIAEPIRE